MKSRRPFAFSLSLSLLVHSAAIGVGSWYVARRAALVLALQSGSGGDGIKPGEIFIAQTTSVNPDVTDASVPPVMMDIVTATPTEDEEMQIVEPASAMSGDPGTGDAFALADSGWIGVGAATADAGSAPHFAPRYAAPSVSASAPPKEIGDGGLGGDGMLISAEPSPSSHNKPPLYPPDARRNGIEGTVILELAILDTGKVGDVTIAKSSGSTELDNAAVEAAGAWTFQPSIAGARLAPAVVQLPVRFVLR